MPKLTSRSAALSARLVADVVVGPCLVVVAGWPLLYLYAFASLIDPRLSRAEYYRELFGKLFLTQTAIATVPLLIVFGFGVLRCLRAVKEVVRPSRNSV